MNLTGRLLPILVVALGVSACGIKKDVHSKALAELNKCQTDLSGANTQVATHASRITALETELAATQKERDSMSLSERKKALQVANMMMTMKTTSAELEAKLIALRKQNERSQKRLKAFQELQRRFRALVDTGKLKVDFRNGQMVIRLPSGVLFAPGRSNLRRPGIKALNEVLSILLNFKDRRFMVAGHTDNLRIRGRFKDNWHLSTARARSVVSLMIKAGFDPKSVVAAGYGQFDPVAKNDSAANRKLNRRIEIILIPDLSHLPNLKVPAT